MYYWTIIYLVQNISFDRRILRQIFIDSMNALVYKYVQVNKTETVKSKFVEDKPMRSNTKVSSLAKTALLPAFIMSALVAGLALLSISISNAVAGEYGKQAASKDIVDTAVAAGSFDTLVQAVQAADLVETLKGEGPFTVFAPTDEAFEKIPADQLNALLADKAALTQVLTYHVVPGKVMAADVVKLESAETAQGQSITIDAGDGVKVDSAMVVQTDIETSNGVIHVIDTVLLPKT